ATLLEEGNLQQLREVAHRLKGSGGLYGFDTITHLAANLETGLKQQQALEDTTKQVNELIELIRRVEGYSHITEGNATKSREVK
ncbi:MAG TPA: Hpt domain-containing protein, partial [Tepidisphaeraceae bacterium]|nr:Hpt domain-containing protein [Tepidisphaeraceae bacterium]